MRLKRVIAAVILILLLFCGASSITASAVSDLDFKILIDPITNPNYDPAKHSDSDKYTDAKGRDYGPGGHVPVHIMVNNQTDRGYMYFEMRLKFNSDIFTLDTQPGPVGEGFSVKVVESDPEHPDHGTFVHIIYNEDSSIAVPSKKGPKYIELQFTVMTKAAEGEYVFELLVDEKKCLGADEGGGIDYDRKNPLTISNANNKKVQIASIEPGEDAHPISPEPTYNTPYTTTQGVKYIDTSNGSGGFLVVVFIVIVMMCLGLVGGFILAQKRYGIDEPFSLGVLIGKGGSPAARARRSAYRGDGMGSRPGRTTGSRRGNGNREGNQDYRKSGESGYNDGYTDNNYGKFDDHDGFGRGGKNADRYADRYSGRTPNEGEDADSYFGRSTSGIGVSMLANNNKNNNNRSLQDEDGGFPDEFIPRKYVENKYLGQKAISREVNLDENADPEFDAYKLLDAHRNSRSDDGYGGFIAAQTAPLDRAVPDDGGFIPRRRFR